MAAIVTFSLIVLCFTSSQCVNQNMALPKGDDYKLQGNSTEKLDWFKPVKWFTDSMLPDEILLPDNLPDIFKDVRNFKDDYWQKLAQSEAGLLVFFVFGVLVAIILPFAMLISCCCCCCCPATAALPKAHRSRRCLISVLILLLLFSLPGVIYLFASSKFIGKVPSTILQRTTDVFDDAIIYLNNTKMQVNYLTKDAFDGMRENVLENLEIEKTLGLNIKNKLDENMEINKFFTAVKAATAGMKNNVQGINDINSFWKQAKFQNISNQISNFKTQIIDYCKLNTGECDRNKLKEDAMNKLPDSSFEEIASVDTFVNKLQSGIEKSEKEFNEIPKRVEVQCVNVVKDVKSNLDNFQTNSKDKTSDFNKYSNEIEKVKLDFNKLVKGKNADVIRQVEINFPKLTMVIACYMLLIWCLFCFGVFFGAVCYQSTYFTEERTCGSHLGGWFLIIAVAVMFIGGSLLWYLSSVLMLVGSNVQEYGCKPLYDPEFKFVKKVFSMTSYNGIKIANSNITISIENINTILNKCKRNIGIYESFDLEKVYNLDDYVYEVDVNSEIDKLANDVKINNLDQDVFSSDLEKNLDELIQQFINPAFKKKIDNQINVDENLESLKTEGNVDLDLLNLEKKTISDQLKLLNNQMQNGRNTWASILKFTEQAKNALVDGQKLKQKLRNNEIETVVLQEIKTFANETVNYVENYKNFILHSLKHEIGGCRPVWNLFDTSRSLICREILDPLNGFWFSLGWCLFCFLLMSIVGCRLSKHFRRLPSNKVSEYDMLSFDD